MTEKAIQTLQTLDEYLVDLDSKRLAAQEDLNGKCVRIEEGIEEMREALQKEVNNAAGKEEARLMDCIRDIEVIAEHNNGKTELHKKLRHAVLKGMRCLRDLQSYEVVETTRAERVRPYELFTVKITNSNCNNRHDNDVDDYNDNEFDDCNTTAAERTSDMTLEGVCTRLKEAVNRQNELRTEAMRAIDDGCNALIDGVGALRGRVNESLERSYKEVFERTQGHIHRVRECGEKCVCEGEMESAQKSAQDDTAFCVEYAITENKKSKGVEDLYELTVKEKVWRLSEMKPRNVCVSTQEGNGVRVVFDLISKRDGSIKNSVWAKQSVCAKVAYCEAGRGEGGEWKEQEMTGGQEYFVPDYVEPEKSYRIKVRVVFAEEESEWSEETEFITPEFSKCCVWKECPEDVVEETGYCVEEGKPRVARKVGDWNYYTIIGNTPLPLNKVTSWSIKILKSKNIDGETCIGVAPFDIDQNEGDYNRNGWYFRCCNSSLCSGPPHNHGGKEYGPEKEYGEYVHEGDSVGVVMDTTKGELSFVVNDVNFGIAYEGIPLDKPLVPSVILENEGDTVELDTSEAKENVCDFIPVPSNVTTKSVTWDSITLTWDIVEGASFYQVEVDGSKLWNATTTNTFTKGGLLPDTKHTFRVRDVCGSEVSEWCDCVKRRTLIAPDFSECVWRECPEEVEDSMKYYLDEKSHRIATMVEFYDSDWTHCTVIGNTPLPLNTVTSWSIKILKFKDNDGKNIYIGVAPFDIDQNEWDNFKSCGWYFDCYNSMICSGPPHNYEWKAYGPRKDNWECVRTGDSVGVVMDMTKGELSFTVNGVNLGVAYEGIPLDKPLVPCVLLENEGDTVELDITEMKENVNSSISVPPNITAKGIAWESIILSWDSVEGASFYQVEVDGSKSFESLLANEFRKAVLLPETEHTFRVRTVCGNEVSEWSVAVKGMTQKAQPDARGATEEEKSKDDDSFINGLFD